MDVDSIPKKHTNENTTDKQYRRRFKPREQTHSHINRARISTEHAQVGKESDDNESNYLTIVHNLQRKRRFTEISNGLNQISNLENSGQANSRHHWNLNKLNTIGGNSDSKKISDLNHERSSGDTDALSVPTNVEYDIPMGPEEQKKRSKCWDEVKDTEFDIEIDLDEARELKYKNVVYH